MREAPQTLCSSNLIQCFLAKFRWNFLAIGSCPLCRVLVAGSMEQSLVHLLAPPFRY